MSLALGRKKIRLVEGNAKCRLIWKMTWKGTLWQLFTCLSLQHNPISHPPPPPLPRNTLNTYMYTFLYSTYSHREKGRGIVLNQREGESIDHRASGSKIHSNTNMNECRQEGGYL